LERHLNFQFRRANRTAIDKSVGGETAVLKPPQSRRCATFKRFTTARSVWTAAVDRRFRPPKDIAKIQRVSEPFGSIPNQKRAGQNFAARYSFPSRPSRDAE
jgi:hypothetical protein